MRVGLYDMENYQALLVMEFPDDHLKSPAPLRVRVGVPGGSSTMLILAFEAIAVYMPAQAMRDPVRTYIARPIDKFTNQVCRMLAFSETEIPDKLTLAPQHRPEFIEGVRRVLCPKR